MPLHKGKSHEVIGENIKEIQDAGHPHDQAVAASLNEARKSGANIRAPSHARHKEHR